MEVYLDHNATTVVGKEVLEAMSICTQFPLNPSSMHKYGQKARSLVEQSRNALALNLGVPCQCLFFTSSGTEAINTLIQGSLQEKTDIITTKIEHSCVYESILAAKNRGSEVTYLPIAASGHFSLDLLKEALDKNRTKNVLVVLGSVNAETGVLLPLEEVSAICSYYQAHLIIDAVAHASKLPVVIYPGISAMCFSAHKFYGPKGVGFFYAKPTLEFSPLLLGGAQENLKRAGTENVEGILGLTQAFIQAQKNVEKVQEHIESLRSYFEKNLRKSGVIFRINGSEKRVCNTSNLCFLNTDGQELLILLDQHGVYASMGSACASGKALASRALIEMGIPENEVRSSIRFSFGKDNTQEEVDYAIATIKKCWQMLN